MTGVWDCYWSGWGSEMEFGPDGDYRHQYERQSSGEAGQRFAGRWSVKDGVLMVEEVALDSRGAPAGAWMEWSVRLKSWPDGSEGSVGRTTGGYEVIWGVRRKDRPAKVEVD